MDTDTSVVLANPPLQSPMADIEVTAETPGEMRQCQSALIEWAVRKVMQCESEHAELKAAYEHAVKRKWKSDTLKRRNWNFP